MTLQLQPGVLDIHGADARSFLQAIVSSDVASLMKGTSQASLLLTPAGKVVSTIWIVCIEDEQFLIVSQKEKIDDVHDALQRLLIRTKAEIENVSDRYRAHILHDSAEPSEDAIIVEEGHLGLTDAVLVLVPFLSEHETPDESEHSYNELRISWGVVSARDDFTADIIPQEAHLERAVSFTKGCYLGQELVCRIDSREASTPFSFYGLTRDLGEIGTVTSARKTDVDSVDGFACGPYKTIVRVPRKATSDLISSDAQQVSGYFAI